MENLKLGILGLDSTHFDGFLEIFRNENIQLDLVFLRDDSSKVIERRISEYPELEDLFSESVFSTSFRKFEKWIVRSCK